MFLLCTYTIRFIEFPCSFHRSLAFYRTIWQSAHTYPSSPHRSDVGFGETWSKFPSADICAMTSRIIASNRPKALSKVTRRSYHHYWCNQMYGAWDYCYISLPRITWGWHLWSTRPPCCMTTFSTNRLRQGNTGHSWETEWGQHASQVKVAGIPWL